ncbi:MAG TPA: hypothetical protein VH583_13925 [Vicinamibacterales bacterium]|jgi:hypothetical protein
MPVRRPLARLTATAFASCLALLTVGLTASTDGPFSIVIRPVFLRLGFDVDVTLGSIHLHANWSALPDAEPATASSTKEPQSTF